MNRLKALLIAATLLTGTIALADSESEQAAEQLLKIVGLEAVFDQAIEQMVDVQLQQKPGLAPYKEIMLQYFEKYAGYESLKPELVKAYSEEFTLSELKELNAFYGSDLGQKSMHDMPKLNGQGVQVGMARVQANMGELQAALKVETERLQALQKK